MKEVQVSFLKNERSSKNFKEEEKDHIDQLYTRKTTQLHGQCNRMLIFCPVCGNALTVQTGQECLKFVCNTCPYVHNVTKRMSNKKFTKLKEVEDVLGGAAAWENVDSTEEVCPKCGHGRAYYMQMQTRSADEPMTIFYKCCNTDCGNRWRE